MLSEKSIIAIGGLGGSGTRLVAHLFKDHGFNIGAPLNNALDNLLFTLYFRRSSWSDSLPSNQEINQAILQFLAHASPDCTEFTNNDAKQYVNDLITSKNTTMFTDTQWHEIIEEHFSTAKDKDDTYPNLVWKEPNTHVFLPQLINQIDNFKYIHVIRDGLYMAQSKNQNQLKLWNKALAVSITSPLLSFTNAFNYWRVANERAIELGRSRLKGNFYLANYDQICRNPKKELSRIMEFIGIEPDTDKVVSIAQTIKYKSLSASEDQQIRLRLTKEQLLHYKVLTEM